MINLKHRFLGQNAFWMTLFHVFLDFLEAEDGMERTRDFRWPPAGRKWPRRCVKNFPRWLGFRCASHAKLSLSCLNCLDVWKWNPRGLHIPTLESMCESSRGYGCTLHHEHQYCRDRELCVSTSSWECRCCAFVAPKKHRIQQPSLNCHAASLNCVLSKGYMLLTWMEMNGQRYFRIYSGCSFLAFIFSTQKKKCFFPGKKIIPPRKAGKSSEVPNGMGYTLEN